MNRGKKLLLMVLSLIMVMAMLLPGVAQAIVYESATSNHSGVVVRDTYVYASKSTKSGNRLASISQGDVIPVSGWSGDYAIVPLADGTGYVKANLIYVTYNQAKVGTTTGPANIYSGLNGKNRAFHYDSAGMKIKVLGRIGSDYRVEVDGGIYYMRVKDLSFSGKTTASPVTGSTGGAVFVRDDPAPKQTTQSSATIFVGSYGGGLYRPGWGYDNYYYWDRSDYFCSYHRTYHSNGYWCGYSGYGYNNGYGYPGYWGGYPGYGSPYYGYSSYSVKLQDQDGNPIEGAYFSLNGRSYHQSAKTEASGWITFSNLPYNTTLTLTQTSTPGGYDKDGVGPWTLVIDSYGSVRQGGASSSSSSITVTNTKSP